jgi:rhodanese-related sulfurtransferase
MKMISKQIRKRLVMGGCLLTFALLSLTPLVHASAAETLPADAAQNWSADYVEALMAQGIIPKPANGRFHPDEQITLGTFVSWLISAKYNTQMTEDECLAIARDEGILAPGLESGDSITRNMTSQITLLALENLFGEEQEGDALALQLKDFASCHMCRIYVSQCYVKGIMIGREERVFSGDELLTRAEGATVVLRTLDPEYRLPPEPDGEDPILLAPDAAKALLEAYPSAVLLDVRNEEELEGGYIPGSICIPLAELKETNGAGLDCGKDEIVIVYCQSGGRSAQAAQFLEEQGFTQVYNMGGVGNWPYGLEYPK